LPVSDPASLDAVMRKACSLSFFVSWMCLAAMPSEAAPIAVVATGTPTPERVREIAAWLPERPSGIGPVAAEREAWLAAAQASGFSGAVTAAEVELARSMGAWDDELYLEFSRNGERARGEEMIRARGRRLMRLMWGELVENRGRFVPAIEETLRELIRQRSWVLPAHDGKLLNFNGRPNVDLVSATDSFQYAQVLHLLGDKLDEGLRREVAAEVERRVLAPVRRMVAGEDTGGVDWLRRTHNWNAVCLAGVTGAALGVVESREERAWFVAVAELYGVNYLAGFTSDGYCSEGVGYYNYGFGYFIALRHSLYAATGGRLDLFADPVTREVARYADRMEMLPGVFAAFSDCKFDQRPRAQWAEYARRALGTGAARLGPEELIRPDNMVFTPLLLELALRPDTPAVAAEASDFEPRSWFPDAQVLVLRPAETRGGLALTIKGGHNEEHHNHNDVGSYAVGRGARVVAGEAGGPHVYNRAMFGPRRYLDFKSLSSHGHPVPKVDGRDQATGRKAAARAGAPVPTPRGERWVLDISDAYGIEGVEVWREVDYRREGTGEAKITDLLRADRPVRFETALVAPGAWERTGPDLIRFGTGDEAVTARIDTGGRAFDLTVETIEENAPAYTRLGVVLREPTCEARVSVTYAPAL
jgi:hypothetical protein